MLHMRLIEIKCIPLVEIKNGMLNNVGLFPSLVKGVPVTLF